MNEMHSQVVLLLLGVYKIEKCNYNWKIIMRNCLISSPECIQAIHYYFTKQMKIKEMTNNEIEAVEQV